MCYTNFDCIKSECSNFILSKGRDVRVGEKGRSSSWRRQLQTGLYGFNNLTKTLSFNIYDVCYAKSEREQKDYIAYIDEQYNSERLTKILCDVTEKIGATVLNISKRTMIRRVPLSMSSSPRVTLTPTT